jgi:hypothetical protein|tara:strand:- start:1224 stop:1331 length:108 start_codon:yes stop_codon:yes gene_type:complete
MNIKDEKKKTKSPKFNERKVFKFPNKKKTKKKKKY